MGGLEGGSGGVVRDWEEEEEGETGLEGRGGRGRRSRKEQPQELQPQDLQSQLHHTEIILPGTKTHIYYSKPEIRDNDNNY